MTSEPEAIARPVPAAIEPEPDWPRRGWEALVDEWRGFFVAAVAITITPRRFTQQWADGERRVLNPLACGLNAFAIVFVWRWLLEWAIGYHMPGSDKLHLDEPWAHTAGILLLGSLYHFPLRLMGSRRRWRTTVGTMLYFAAGPWLLSQLVALPVEMLGLKRASTALTMLGLPFVPMQFSYYVLTQMGAHKLSWWRALVAFALFCALVSLLLVLFVRGLLPSLREHALVTLPDMR